MNSIDFSPKHHALLYSSIAQACSEILGDNCASLLSDATVAYAKNRGPMISKKMIQDPTPVVRTPDFLHIQMTRFSLFSCWSCQRL